MAFVVRTFHHLFLAAVPAVVDFSVQVGAGGGHEMAHRAHVYVHRMHSRWEVDTNE